MKNPLTVLSFISINVLNNLLGIIRAKLIAVLYGVAEIGILGQLMAFFNLESAIATFGTKVALITLIGKTEGQRKYGIIFSGLILLSLINLIILFIALLLAPIISVYVFKSAEYQNLIIALAMVIPLFATKEFLESVFQADKKFRILAIGKTVGVIAGVIAIGPLIYFYGIFGVVFDLAIWYCAEIVYLLYFQFQSTPVSNVYFKYIKEYFKPVLKISGLNIIRHLAIASAMMLMRVAVIQLTDVVQAGYFQAVWSVANYMNILMAGFSFYFLPLINSFVNSDRFSAEIKENLSMLLHLIFPVVLVILVFPTYLLLILYSDKFIHLHNLLGWMAFGKIFEILYLFYIMILVAQDKLKIYLSIELLRAAIVIVAPYLLISMYGLEGAIAGMVVANVIALGILLFTIRKETILLPNRTLAFQLLKIVISVLLIIAIPYLILKLAISIAIFFWALDFKNYTKIFFQFRQRMKQNSQP